MTVAVAQTCREKVEAEKARLDGVLARRGQFYEDEQAQHTVLTMVLIWMDEEKRERDQIEVAAREAEEFKKAEEYRNDPNRKTKDLFGPYRDKLKQEGRMR